ncbi:DUF4253 domain-containing protein [Nocardia sp. NPDC005825]|uniref:DUF4253 domain-containing protein n=1 Tax=unclassified Nocardia TaxID=2637762 RepID=UPI0033D5553F
MLWTSDASQPDAGLIWSWLYDLRSTTGLYPLLLDAPKLVGSPPHRPWHSGELGFVPKESIDELDPNLELRGLWFVTDFDIEYDPLKPFEWPGLAAPGLADEDGPDDIAHWLAQELVGESDWLIGLVPATRGADAVTLFGWNGAVNYYDSSAVISSVLRSWEDRFGARVVGVGFDYLELSVSAPPRTHAHAVSLAIEHEALCPDNFADDTLGTYADTLINRSSWQFWWD